MRGDDTSGSRRGNYHGYDRKTLTQWLHDGDPDQVRTLQAHWHGIMTGTQDLAFNLTKDLGSLQWDGPAGVEYRNRLGAISDFSTSLNRDSERMYTGLGVMAADLTIAKTQAAMVDGQSSANSSPMAVATNVVLSAAGAAPAVLAAQQKADKQAADQLATTTEHLSDNYEKVQTTHFVEPSAPPARMSTAVRLNGAGDQSGPAGGAYNGVSARTGNTSTDRNGVTTGTYQTVGTLPTTGGTGPGTLQLGTDPTHTGLAGAGGGPYNGLTNGGLASGTTTGATPTGAGPNAGLMPGAGLAGAVAPNTTPGRGGARLAGDADRAATLAAEDEEAGLYGRNAGMPVGTRTPADRNHDERYTWLTEDEMVWYDEDDTPPAVLGRPTHPTT